MKHKSIQLPFNTIVIGLVAFTILLIITAFTYEEVTNKLKSLSKTAEQENVVVLDIRAKVCLDTYLSSIDREQRNIITSLSLRKYKCIDGVDITECEYVFENTANNKFCNIVLSCNKNTMKFLEVLEETLNNCYKDKKTNEDAGAVIGGTDDSRPRLT